MSNGNGILCLALIMALCAMAPIISQAKPPDLPVDPRIDCPEGRDAVPSPGTPESDQEEIREAWPIPGIAEMARLLQMFFATPVLSDQGVDFDDDFREMLRSTEPLQLAPRATGEPGA